MSRDPDLHSETPDQTPSRGLAGLAAAVPFFATTLCCVGMPMAMGDGSPAQIIEVTGVGFFFIVIATVVAAIAMVALVGLAGVGKRVPSSVAIAFASLPWIIGLATSRFSLYQVESAIAFADPSSRVSLIAAGLSEGMMAHVYGASVSAGALVGLALGLSIGALAQRAPHKKLAAVALALTALPFAGATIYLATFDPSVVFAIAAVALSSVIVVGLGAIAIGNDGPHQRSGALASAAVAAVALAFVAACAAAWTSSTISVFQAIAFVDPELRTQVVARSAEEVGPFRTMASFGIAIGLVPLLAVAGYAAFRARPSAGRLVGAASVVVVLLVTVALDAAVASAGPASLGESLRGPWADVDGFSPVAIELGDDERAPHALVAPDGLHPVDGGPVVALDASLLATTFQTMLANPPPSEGGVPEWLRVEELAWEDEGALARFEPELVLALDARLEPATVRLVLVAAVDAGAHAVRVVGSRGEPVSAEQRDAIAHGLPAFSAFLDQRASVVVRLESGLPEGAANSDVMLMHGTIGAGAPTVLTPRVGRDEPPIALDEALVAEPSSLHTGSYSYLALGPDAAATDLVTAVARAERTSYLPVVVLGQIPGHPDQRVVDPANSDDVLGVLGALMGDQMGDSSGFAAVDTLGSAPTPGFGEGTGLRTTAGTGRRVTSGAADVRGSLSREVIQRVIRRHINEARYCYEVALQTRPSLAGRVTVSFIIGPTGSVQTATVQSSTLGDATAEQCIATAARRWQFPAPEGGGVVAVSYPFVFQTEP